MRVIVAMSGGIDSAVAGWLLQQAGHEVVGVTLRLWRTSRLSTRYVERAGKICSALGVRHEVVDARRAFERLVVEPFCGDYLAGRTPNPCVICNAQVKLAALIRKAGTMGAEKVATGHYARLSRRPDGAAVLRKATDRRKDQSYMLYRLTPEQLSRVLFPLGERRKGDVRRMARRFWPWQELPAESQEVCFLPPEGYAGFIRRRLGPGGRPGRVVDTQGNVLARHGGVFKFTIGQRRRLGFAAGEPRYVVRIKPETDTVIVGEKEETYRSRFTVRDTCWCSSCGPKELSGRRIEVKIRYGHSGAPAELRPLGDRVEVTFVSPQQAIAPGQSAVFYEGDLVLGGGIIESVFDPQESEGRA